MSSNIEWLKIDEKEKNYHLNQYSEPKEYTKYIEKRYRDVFNQLPEGANILDIGCGAGAATNYFAGKYPHLNFIGIDINEEYINIANEHRRENSKFSCNDFSDIEKLTSDKFSLVLCLQTLSWLPDYNEFIKALSIIRPDTSIITSLFYDGPVDAYITIKDHSRTMGDIDFRETYYNIYSISRFNQYVSDFGFTVETYEPFEISIDITRDSTNKGMATYTEKLQSGKRIQISGPLLMSWYTLTLKNTKQ